MFSADLIAACSRTIARSCATWNGASDDRALAEDILQEAFAKVVARPEQATADESVIPWF